MNWQDHRAHGRIFPLSHLHGFSHRFVRSAEGGLPEEVFVVNVEFSHHCFTRRQQPQEIVRADLIYPTSTDQRIFDEGRYELSKSLPAIVRSLPSRKPSHSNARGHFFVVDVTTWDGHVVKYDVYFSVRKTGKDLLLFINSAFVRDAEHEAQRPRRNPIGFWIILHNTRHGKAIRR